MDFEGANIIAKKVIQNGKDSITIEEKKLAQKVYRQITGKHFRGCGNCWGALYVETERLILETKTNNNKSKTMQQFKLKPGKLICLHGLEPIGEKNMTDDLAKKILKISKSHIKSFASFPQDWEKQVDDYKPVIAKKTEAATNAKKSDDVVSDAAKGTEDNGGDNSEEAKAQAKEKLEGMSKKELKDVCESHNYPVKEYEKLNKEKLVDYILERI